MRINKAAIKNNKHIISEKPLTINSRQSAELLQLLKKHNVVNAINFNYRFYPIIQHAKSMIEQGEVGDIYLVHGNYLQDWLYYKTDYNWRLESNLGGDSRAIADIGSHWCDMVQFLTGSKIKKVFADLATIHKTRIKPDKAVETFKGKEKKWRRARAWRTSSPGTPRSTCSTRSMRSAGSDGANLEVRGYEFAPNFSIWTTIEECLNPPVAWEKGRGWFTTEPFSEPETFEFPEGIGRQACVNVEHEEVLLVPRAIECNRVTFKYGLGDEFINVLKTLRRLGLDSTRKVRVRDIEVAPRDVVAATLPDPMTLGGRMVGKTCAGTLVTGLGKDGRPRKTDLYHGRASLKSPRRSVTATTLTWSTGGWPRRRPPRARARSSAA